MAFLLGYSGFMKTGGAFNLSVDGLIVAIVSPERNSKLI
jgi:hypothetical protein